MQASFRKRLQVPNLRQKTENLQGIYPENYDFTDDRYDYDLYFEDDQQMKACMGLKFPQKAAKKSIGQEAK